ncbi:lysyl oxidase homolog 2A-like [Patiria miniata]|uniref:SRCR domain-containing protein n=1 Tax=Patiria miniata TaxID=46514 RepID=A0A914AYE0_PATMI|nr:lysyl oxidase homolog 2A-like [Patiria miniata]
MVMIEFNGVNGTVCNDDWNVYAADVVCKQVLGSTSKSTARFPPPEGSTPNVFLDGVECRGDEAGLMDCVHGKLGQSGGCTGQDNAGVICWNPTGFQEYAFQHAVLRLIGGPSSTEGRVEAFIEGSWGAVCDEKWDKTNAAVLCKQLGCFDAKEASTGSKYGPGVLDIKLTDVVCDGTETDMINCLFTVLSPDANTTCTNATEAGAICDCELTVIIGDGQTNQGILRAQLAGESEARTLCSETFDLRSADVACREAGFPGALSFSSAEGNITGPGLESSCAGWEISLRACPVFTKAQCTDGKAVEVMCQPKEGIEPTSKPSTTKPPSGGLSTGAIVGIVIGCLLGLLLVIIVGFLLCRKRREGPAAI